MENGYAKYPEVSFKMSCLIRQSSFRLYDILESSVRNTLERIFPRIFENATMERDILILMKQFI